jgi:hypothetical protein
MKSRRSFMPFPFVKARLGCVFRSFVQRQYLPSLFFPSSSFLSAPNSFALRYILGRFSEGAKGNAMDFTITYPFSAREKTTVPADLI